MKEIKGIIKRVKYIGEDLNHFFPQCTHLDKVLYSTFWGLDSCTSVIRIRSLIKIFTNKKKAPDAKKQS